MRRPGHFSARRAVSAVAVTASLALTTTPYPGSLAAIPEEYSSQPAGEEPGIERVVTPVAEGSPEIPAGHTLAAPGAPMRMSFDPLLDSQPAEMGLVSCTQGFYGTVTTPDGQRKNVMVTAGHCVYGVGGLEGDGAVYAVTPEGRVLLGVGEAGGAYQAPARAPIDAANLPDWAVVAVEPAHEPSRMVSSRPAGADIGQTSEPVRLTGVRDYRDLQVWEVSADNFLQPICKDGSTSGRSCGIQLFRTSEGLWSINTGYQHGDSGGINYDPVTGEALGVTSLVYPIVVGSEIVGDIGRAQPIDVALETAYGIPDGEVAERVTLPDSTAAYADAGPETDVAEWIEQLATFVDWAESTDHAAEYRAELDRTDELVRGYAQDFAETGAELAGAVFSGDTNRVGATLSDATDLAAEARMDGELQQQRLVTAGTYAVIEKQIEIEESIEKQIQAEESASTAPGGPLVEAI